MSKPITPAKPEAQQAEAQQPSVVSSPSHRHNSHTLAHPPSANGSACQPAARASTARYSLAVGEAPLSRRHFLQRGGKHAALALLATRAGLLLSGGSLLPRLSPTAQAHPLAWAVGRFLLTRVLNRFVRSRAVRIIAHSVFNAARMYAMGESERFGSNIQRVHQQVSSSGYTQVHPETFVMTGSAQAPSSFAYLAAHDDGKDCCVVMVDSTGSNPIYLNGAVAAAFAYISDNWEAFLAQQPDLRIDARSALVPVSPSAQQSLRSGFNYDYPATRVYPTRIGSVRINYQVISASQGRLDVHVYYGSQSIYWDAFVLDFA